MGYLGEDIKKLGFGLMRLPQKDGKIDVEQTKVMVDKFLDAGFTYFDTAWAYAGSEDAIRQALVERYPRDKFQLATKNAAWINCKTREEAIAPLLNGYLPCFPSEPRIHTTTSPFINFPLANLSYCSSVIHNKRLSETTVLPSRFDALINGIPVEVNVYFAG